MIKVNVSLYEWLHSTFLRPTVRGSVVKGWSYYIFVEKFKFLTFYANEYWLFFVLNFRSEHAIFVVGQFYKEFSNKNLLYKYIINL